MKMRLILVVMVAVAFIGFGSTAKADTFTPDNLIGAISSANSGQAYEEAQLELACSCDVTLLTNVNTSTFLTDDAGNNYLDVDPNTPGYFLLKFGTGNTGSDMFFFQNIAELTKLVWTDTQLTDAGLPADHLQSISHYAITSSTPPTQTPEPASMLLLGLGLAGVPFLRRRRS